MRLRRLIVIWVLPLVLLGCGGTDPVAPAPVDETTGAAVEADNASLQQAVFTVDNPKRVSADSGTICDGCTLDPPSDFLISECVFSVGLTGTSSNTTRHVSVSDDGKVICKIYSVNDLGQNETKGCSASYVLFCAR